MGNSQKSRNLASLKFMGRGAGGGSYKTVRGVEKVLSV